MGTITKELFIKTIESLRDQLDDDAAKAYLLSQVLKCDTDPYDNSKLSEAIFSLLEIHFKDKIEDIKIFCFDLDFGRKIPSENCPIEELWQEVLGDDLYTISLENPDNMQIKKHIPWKEEHQTIDMTNQIIFENSSTKTNSIKEEQLVDINKIEVIDHIVISPLKDRKYSIEDE